MNKTKERLTHTMSKVQVQARGGGDAACSETPAAAAATHERFSCSPLAATAPSRSLPRCLGANAVAATDVNPGIGSESGERMALTAI